VGRCCTAAREAIGYTIYDALPDLVDALRQQNGSKHCTSQTPLLLRGQHSLRANCDISGHFGSYFDE
jgi:hypothetical protein